MATAPARQALIWLATVASLAAIVRVVRLHDDGAAAARLGAAAAFDGQPELEAQLAASDSAHDATARGKRKSGKRRRGEAKDSATKATLTQYTSAFDAKPPLVDVDRASAAELDQLPGIGPALARRIVADRDAHGPFGSMEALRTVRGIGPKMAAELEPLVTWSSPPRPLPPPDSAAAPARRRRKRAATAP